MERGVDMFIPTDTQRGRKNGFNGRELYVKKDWNIIPKKEYFDELFRVSKNQIVWGGNYFSDMLPPSRGWVYWDKKISTPNDFKFSDGELAWTSFDKVLRKFTYDWIGIGYINNPQKEKKIHVNQKPVALYKWLLDKYASLGDKIFDSHMGSQSSRIAAYDLGFDYFGCEIDKDYFDAGCKRFEMFKSQLKLEYA